jgi:hypothetical protein
MLTMPSRSCLLPQDREREAGRAESGFAVGSGPVCTGSPRLTTADCELPGAAGGGELFTYTATVAFANRGGTR